MSPRAPRKLTRRQRAEVEAMLARRRGTRPRWPQVYVAALYGVSEARICQIAASMRSKP